MGRRLEDDEGLSALREIKKWDFSLWIRKKGVTLQIKNTEYDNIQL